MIVIDNKLVSEDVVEKKFVCNLARCKGGCCEDGDAGAPLTTDELTTVKEIFEQIKPYLTEASLKEIEAKGLYVYNPEFEWVTPTIGSNAGICVYGIREKTGMIKCAFEQAYNDGITNWKKPISCHLYPIVAEKGKHGDYEKVNYEPREKLCKPGCVLGEELKQPVYVFLKEALIRKYGEDFYNTLDQLAREYYAEKQ